MLVEFHGVKQEKDGAVPWDHVQTEFSGRATELEPAIRDWVLDTFTLPR